jgi:hypothetical protein
MAIVNNSDLRPTGFDLFSDSEGYMDELNDTELDSIHGGLTPGVVLTAIRVGQVAAYSTQQCAIGIAGAAYGVKRWFDRD